MLIGLGTLGVLVLLVLIAVIILLKGYALWHAARRGEMWWFIIMLVVNTVGILELIYIIFILKKWPKRGDSAGHKTPVADTVPSPHSETVHEDHN